MLALGLFVCLLAFAPETLWTRADERRPASLQDRWSLFAFGEKRRVERVRLIVFGAAELDGGPGKPVLDVPSNAPFVIQRATAAMQSPLVRVFPGMQELGVGDLPYAELLIRASDGEFTISLHDYGFVLGSRFSSIDNQFVSWTLARVVDDLYRSKTGKRLSRLRFRGLSGESLLATERNHYDRAVADEEQRQWQAEEMPPKRVPR
jgi:hypothetical protein